MRAALAIAGFLGCIPAANYLITHVGTCVAPGGPCVVTLAGIAFPTSVVVVGLALVLRDEVQEAVGLGWTLICVTVGIALSVAVAPALVAGASALGFAASEFSDTFVYTATRRWGRHVAVGASGTVSAVVDSVVFQMAAFGSLAYVPGQVLGKWAWSVVVALWLWQRFRARSATLPE